MINQIFYLKVKKYMKFKSINNKKTQIKKYKVNKKLMKVR